MFSGFDDIKQQLKMGDSELSRKCQFKVEQKKVKHKLNSWTIGALFNCQYAGIALNQHIAMCILYTHAHCVFYQATA